VGGIGDREYRFVLASIASANFLPAFTGYMLAAAMLFGYAGFGLVSLASRDRRG